MGRGKGVVAKRKELREKYGLDKLDVSGESVVTNDGVGKVEKRGGKRDKNGLTMLNELRNMEHEDAMNLSSVMIELMLLPDIDMNSVEEVGKRLTEYFKIYFERGLKPTVAGMAIALNGHDRHWLWAVTHNQPTGSDGYKAKLRPEVTLLIKRAYQLLETGMESYLIEGKIIPVAGIFHMKNNFGYRDQVEQVVTNKERDINYNIDEIKERYQPQIQERLSEK